MKVIIKIVSILFYVIFTVVAIPAFVLGAFIGFSAGIAIVAARYVIDRGPTRQQDMDENIRRTSEMIDRLGRIKAQESGAAPFRKDVN